MIIKGTLLRFLSNHNCKEVYYGIFVGAPSKEIEVYYCLSTSKKPFFVVLESSSSSAEPEKIKIFFDLEELKEGLSKDIPEFLVDKITEDIVEKIKKLKIPI